MAEEELQTLAEKQPKKSRRRKKHLYQKILQQMDFYFSDSNLSKDRFLAQLLANESHVDIEVFLKCNKIKKLNCTVEDIQKAISKSDVIGLTEDCTKLFRKKPLKIKENVDFCTIYVEGIKVDASHESLSEIFSDFGQVVYVSIPKYKHNKSNKGFAFIEYATEQQANEAIAFFDSIDCKMPSEKSAEELQSVLTFQQEQQADGGEKYDAIIIIDEVKNDDKIFKTDNEELAVEKQADVEIEEVEKREANDVGGKKNKRKNEESDDDLVRNKKQKTDDEEAKSQTDELDNSKDIQKISDDVKGGDDKGLKTDNEESAVKEPADMESAEKQEAGVEEGKAKKRKNEESDDLKKKQKTDGEEAKNQPDDTDDSKKKKKNKKEKRKAYIKELGMQVLLKKEWKKIRNRYLDLQRKKMKLFKQHLHRQKFSPKSDTSPYYNEEIEEPVLPMMIEGTDQEATKLAYTPGVIVKLRLLEPCEEAKKLRNEVKSLSTEIKYVDVPMPAGSEEIFLRFSTEDAAKEFCNHEYPGEKSVLEGDDERSYWEKIQIDRAVKHQKMARKQRGRDKLLKRAEKESARHMRFEEYDDND